MAYNLWTVNVYKDKVRYFLTTEIEKSHHVFHSSIDVDNKTITIDVVVDKYEENLTNAIVSQLPKYNLAGSKIKVFQTIKAINNTSEIQVLQQQINSLKEEIDKLK